MAAGIFGALGSILGGGLSQQSAPRPMGYLDQVMQQQLLATQNAMNAALWNAPRPQSPYSGLVIDDLLPTPPDVMTPMRMFPMAKVAKDGDIPITPCLPPVLRLCHTDAFKPIYATHKLLMDCLPWAQAPHPKTRGIYSDYVHAAPTYQTAISVPVDPWAWDLNESWWEMAEIARLQYSSITGTYPDQKFAYNREESIIFRRGDEASWEHPDISWEPPAGLIRDLMRGAV